MRARSTRGHMPHLPARPVDAVESATHSGEQLTCLCIDARKRGDADPSTIGRRAKPSDPKRAPRSQLGWELVAFWRSGSPPVVRHTTPRWAGERGQRRGTAASSPRSQQPRTDESSRSWAPTASRAARALAATSRDDVRLRASFHQREPRRRGRGSGPQAREEPRGERQGVWVSVDDHPPSRA